MAPYSIVFSTPPPPKRGSERFIVGVDFGTSFTTVAFAHTACPKEIRLVDAWPNCPRYSDTHRVPSEIHYTDPMKKEYTWGYEIPPSVAEPLRWFKLLLQEQAVSPAIRQQPAVPLQRENDVNRRGIDPSSTLDSPLTPAMTPAGRAAQKLREMKILPVTAVTNFLSGIRRTIVASIERLYPVEYVGAIKIEYVLTVPAMWSDSAKDLMVEAVETAGFGKNRVDFNLISELEAVALYIFEVIQPNTLHVGDSFVLCDAGEGTVDLISYKITNLHPLKLDKTVPSSGDFCGSDLLDQGFEQYIRKVLGDTIFDGLKPHSRNGMMRTWKDIKFRFGNNGNDKDYEVSVAGVLDDPGMDIEDGFHLMQSDTIKKIFDCTVDRIIMLVREQVACVRNRGDNVAAIILTGEFGLSSPYLSNRLESANYGTGKSIAVFQPPNGRTVVARGALLQELQRNPMVRYARRSYGCSALIPYEEGKGAEDRKYWQNGECKFMVSDHIDWFIRRNMAFEGEVLATISLYRLVPFPFYTLEFNDEIFASDLDDPPDYSCSDDVYRVCTIHSDMSDIPYEKFAKITDEHGQQFCQVKYELRVAMVSEVLKYELMFDGKSRGEVTANYD